MSAETEATRVVDDLLTVEGLTFGYRRADRPLFTDLGFSCPPGTLTAIEGQNGSGKSTLLEICAGLRQPTSGRVTRGAPLAYLPQSSGSLLPNLSGLEHAGLFGAACGLGSRAAADAVARTVERLGLPGSELRQKVRRLSGGSQQKVSLALSLIDQRARLLFLDEPYAGFDADSLMALIDLFADLQRDGRSILLVNHLTDPRLRIDRFVHLGRRRDR